MAAAFVSAALLCSSAGGSRVTWWLLACGVLWALSVTDVVSSLSVPARAGWAALWFTLAAGTLGTWRQVPIRVTRLSRRAGQAANRSANGGLSLNGARRVAGASAAAVAAVSLLAACLTWAGAGGRWAAAWWPGPGRSDWAIVAQGACALMVPLAVGVALGRRRAARATAAALLSQLGAPPTMEGVQNALRTALGDPTATIFYWSPADSDFISAAGEPVDPPGSQPGRLVFPVSGSGSDVTTFLSILASPQVDNERVEVALVACRPALENARLQAILRSQLREARTSRARIVQTAVAERRKLARDLHDGAQQHLHVLSTSLGLARQQTTQPQSLAAIDAAQAQLRIALRKLRGLGRDLYPAVLDTEGLTAALESLADDAPLDVGLASTVGRLDPSVEIVAYLTVRETLDSLAQHAAATRAQATLATEADRLTVRVVSDGRPTGDDRLPEWLSVVADRIRADGGDIRIGSSSDPVAVRGTIWIEAWIPCG